MPWRPLPRIAFAIATYPFQPSSPADLPLELGDELYIIEEGGKDGSWYRGYLVAPPSLLAGLTSVKGQTLEARVFSGIFPRTCVEIRELLGETGVNDAPLTEANGNGDVDRHQGLSASPTSAKKHSSTEGSEQSKNSPQLYNPRSDSLKQGMDPKSSPKTKAKRRSLGPALPLTPVSMSSPRDSSARPPAPVPMLKIGDETPTSFSEPLVDEIASCMREWHSTNLHELLLTRQYDLFNRISKLIRQLNFSRRQLLLGILTKQELITLREQIVWDLVDGNKMLSQEVIVRDPGQSGRLLTGSDSSIEVSKLQSTMSLLDKPPVQVLDSVAVNLHHLMFELKDISHYRDELPTLNVYLCIKKAGEPPRALTESYLIDIPSREPVTKIAQKEWLRAFFTDLTSLDVGGTSGSDTMLYLVIKVQTKKLTEPASLLPARSGNAKDSLTRKDTNAGKAGRRDTNIGRVAQTGAPKGGRRSLMWASNKLSGAQKYAQDSNESVTSQDTRDSEPRPSSNAAMKALKSQQGPQFVKKDVGIAVLPLKDILHQEGVIDQSLTVWSVADAATGPRPEDDSWHEIIRDLLPSRHSYSRSRSVNNINVHLHSFIGEDADALIRLTPTVLHNVPKTAKIGFSGVPTKPRSDIYVTLSKPIIPSGALFAYPQRGAVALSTNPSMNNLQLTLEVRKSNGQLIQHAVFPSSNSPGVTAWRTTAISKTSSWSQTIRLAIPPDDVKDAHLIMSLADFPEFPFALCWMPLWTQGAFIQDGTHYPLLHLYDATTSSLENGRGVYLDMPWDSKAKDGPGAELVNGPLASLQLETYLCSTTLSQDQVLLGILGWKEQQESQILSLLKQIVFVPEIEIVKLVSNVFDALFAILVDRSGNDEYEDLVFNAIVTVLGIVHDRRFNLGPLLDEYAEVRFNYPFATPCLVKSFLRLITSQSEYKNSRQLRATLKVGKQIMKFIITARVQQKTKEAGIGITGRQVDFTRDFKKIFEALENQMRDQSAGAIGSKTLAVQHFHTWLPELRPCFEEKEIMEIAFSFLNSCVDVAGQGKLILHKLVLIWNLAKIASNMDDIGVKKRFNAEIAVWLSPYWGPTNDVTEQYRDQVRLCCSIAALRDGDYGDEVSLFYGKIIESVHSIEQARRPTSDTLSFLFPSTFPFPCKLTAAPRNYDEHLLELAALKATFAPQELVEKVGLGDGDLSYIISIALEVNKAILSGKAFPNSWLTLHVYHHRKILDMLGGIAEIMVQKFLPAPEDADSFPIDLWKSLLSTLLQLVRSEALALETLPEQKRRAVWKIVGDIREQGAYLLGRIWDAIGWETDEDEKKQYGLSRLGGYQVQYVPDLVAPIVELCLSVHEGLRRVAVEILQSMIISEWSLNEDLAVVQTEMINCLDQLFKAKNIGENAQQKLFIAQLTDLFEPLSQTAEAGLWEAIKSLVGTIDQLLDLLVDVHSPDQNEPSRIMHTLQLMDFLRGMQKEDIYISYVHQLATVEIQSRNFKEAGLAICLHADLYTWDIGAMMPELKFVPLPQQSSFHRKEALYLEMIKHFEEGQAWDAALSCYRELAEQYEHRTFDFAKLARTQRATATIYDRIARGEGQYLR